MNLIFFLYLLIHFASASSSSLPLTPSTLVKTPSTMKDIPSVQQHNITISNYFFSKLPQASLPTDIKNALYDYYNPLLQFLPPVSANQTQEERAQEVMTHIEKFYGLLYSTACFEKGLINPTQSAPSLSLDDIYKSQIWQNYLKISIAEYYQQEQDYLSQLFQSNQKIFQYLPSFELSYYNSDFVSLRTTAELTRIYLMLSESLRKRLCSLCLDWAPLFKNINVAKQSGASFSNFINQSLEGLKAIKQFKAEEFFINIEKLKKIDPTKTFPLSFTDHLGNPISFEQFLESNYDYSNYFTYSPQTGPRVNTSFELFFTITQDAKTNSYNCYFTGLGHAVFAQPASGQDEGFPYGKLKYTSLKLSGGKTKFKVYFEHNDFFNTLFNGDPVSPTFGFFCFLSVSSIKYLHFDLSPLFSTEYLERSLESIEQQRKNNPTFPSCINYAQQDYMYLKKINEVYKDLKDSAPTSAQGVPQHSVVHFFKKVVSAVVQAAEDVYADIKNAATYFAEAVGHAVVATIDEAAVLYYSTCIFPAVFQGMDPADSLHQAAEYQAQVSAQLTSCMNDLVNTVNSIGQAFEDLNDLTATIVGSFVGMMDSKLGDDITGMIEAYTDAVIGALETADDFLIESAFETVILSADAIGMIASSFGMILTGQEFNKDAWAALGEDGMNMIQDVVSAVLANITLALQFVQRELKDAMLFCSYLISFITESLTVIAACAAALSMAIYDGLLGIVDVAAYVISGGQISDFGNIKNVGDTYWNAYNAIEQYGGIISAVVGIGLLVAVTVLTGGVSLEVTGPMMAMMAMNIAMSAMSLADAVQDNLLAIEKQHHEEDVVDTYQKFVINSFKTSQAFLANRALESFAQYQMSQDNTERSLLYYQNNYNTQFNNTISQKAFSLSGYVKGAATYDTQVYNSPTSGAVTYPYDTSVAAKGDLGQLYGINTGRLTVWPSTGFSVYNSARDTFAQEGLVNPLWVTDSTLLSNKLKQDELKTFWYAQKDISFLPLGTPLEADVLWRVTAHREMPFYVGIYLTERAIDLASLQFFFSNYAQTMLGGTVSYQSYEQMWKPFDMYNKFITDFDNLAKLFVVNRNPVPGNSIEANNQATLGAYVVNSTSYTTGWVPSTLRTINFKRGTWYRMKTSLQNDTLSVAFYEIGNDQEYQQIINNPTVTGTPIMQQTVTVDKATYSSELLSVAPALKNYSGSMGFVASGAAVEYKVLTPAAHIAPTPLYTSQYNNMLSTIYANSKPMEKDREIAWQASLKNATSPSFGAFKLAAIDAMNIMTGSFIYYSIQQQMDDVITFFTQDSKGNYTLNVNPSEKVQGIASLATGLTYNSTGEIIGYIPNILNIYQKRYASLSADVLTKIAALQKIFIQELSAPIQFKNCTLRLISTPESNAFIYQGPSLLLPNVTDFYVAAYVPSTGVNMVNIPVITSNSHNTVNAFISISSGHIYFIQSTSGTLSPASVPLSLQVPDTLSLVDSKTSYTTYSTYESSIHSHYQSQLKNAYNAYQTYLANLKKEEAFAAQLSNAINQATTAAQNASTQANLAQASSTTVAQSATNASQAASTAAAALQSILNQYQQALTTNNSSLITTLTPQAQQQLQVTLQAAAAANSAAQAAQNAITQAAASLNALASTSSTGQTATQGSSTQNFNTTYSQANPTSPSSSSSNTAGSNAGSSGSSGLSM